MNFRSYLGKVLTTPVRVDNTAFMEQENKLSEGEAEEMAKEFWMGRVMLERARGCKAAYIASSRKVPCILFVDGKEYYLPKGKLFDRFAKVFCNKQIPLFHCRSLFATAAGNCPKHLSNLIQLFKLLLLRRSLERNCHSTE